MIKVRLFMRIFSMAAFTSVIVTTSVIAGAMKLTAILTAGPARSLDISVQPNEAHLLQIYQIKIGINFAEEYKTVLLDFRAADGTRFTTGRTYSDWQPGLGQSLLIDTAPTVGNLITPPISLSISYYDGDDHLVAGPFLIPLPDRELTSEYHMIVFEGDQ